MLQRSEEHIHFTNGHTVYGTNSFDGSDTFCKLALQAVGGQRDGN